MSSKDVHRIREKTRLQELLQGVLESLKDYLQIRARATFGKNYRFCGLSYLDSIQKVGRTGLTLVTGVFQTEEGQFKAQIALKHFESDNEAIRQHKNTNSLLRQLKKAGLQVSTPLVLLRSGSTLVYEGIDASTIDDCHDLSETTKNFLAGRTLAAYHGSDTSELISQRRYKFLIRMLLKKLVVIPETRRKKLLDRAIPFLDELNGIYGGICGFGDFHSENILLQPLAKNSLDPKNWKTWLLDPEFAEDAYGADRMEDVATFFVHPALEELKKTESLDKTLRQYVDFVSGYDSVLMINGTTLQKIYKGKAPAIFVFHLGLSSLYKLLFIQKNFMDILSEEQIAEELVTTLELTNRCWSGFL